VLDMSSLGVVVFCTCSLDRSMACSFGSAASGAAIEYVRLWEKRPRWEAQARAEGAARMLRRGNIWRREEAMACEGVGVLPGGMSEECWVVTRGAMGVIGLCIEGRAHASGLSRPPKDTPAGLGLPCLPKCYTAAAVPLVNVSTVQLLC
jgi:hypothetical protein